MDIVITSLAAVLSLKGWGSVQRCAGMRGVQHEHLAGALLALCLLLCCQLLYSHTGLCTGRNGIVKECYVQMLLGHIVAPTQGLV